MAFNVCFYKYTKRPNSTKAAPYPPGNWGGVWNEYNNITLKDRCSIQNPVIVLHLASAQSNPVEYNYCYIPDFGRYYFVTDWVNDAYNWEAHLSVDVLATYQSQIGSSTQYILRSSHSSDGNIVDNYYPTKAGSVTNEQATSFWPSNPNSGYYVVGIINADQGADHVGAVAYYVFTVPGMEAFMRKLFDTTSFTGFVNGDSNLSDSVYKSLFDPMQYITSCMWVPFQPHTMRELGLDNGLLKVPYGYWEIDCTGLISPRVCDRLDLSHYSKRQNLTFASLPKHPQASSRGNYLNLAPFTRYTLFFKPFGMIPLDPVYLQSGNALYCTVDLDCITGQAVLTLSAISSGGTPFFTQTAQVGVPVQLAQMSRDYLGAAANALGGVSGTIMSALSGNIPGAIANAAAAVGSTAASMLPQVSTTGANGSFVEMYQDTVLSAVFLPLVDEDNADRGRPLCKKGTVSAYPGYLMIADPDVEIRTATRAEMDAIRNYMTSGFFYE